MRRFFFLWMKINRRLSRAKAKDNYSIFNVINFLSLYTLLKNMKEKRKKLLDFRHKIKSFYLLFNVSHFHLFNVDQIETLETLQITQFDVCELGAIFTLRKTLFFHRLSQWKKRIALLGFGSSYKQQKLMMNHLAFSLVLISHNRSIAILQFFLVWWSSSYTTQHSFLNNFVTLTQHPYSIV
jgi:hypothetical protein